MHGISSAIAYKIDASAGGIDVIAYYIALKKSKLVGRYSVYINTITISLYTLFTISDAGWGTQQAARAFVATLFSILYLFVCMFIIDLINVRNKKFKIEAISEKRGPRPYPDREPTSWRDHDHGQRRLHREGEVRLHDGGLLL